VTARSRLWWLIVTSVLERCGGGMGNFFYQVLEVAYANVIINNEGHRSLYDLVCFFSGWPFEAFLFFSDLPQLSRGLL
jgi:hypothetical protein